MTGTATTSQIDMEQTLTEFSGHAVRLGVYEDPLVEQLGHPIAGLYVELFWLPLLGPSALWAGRRCVLLTELHMTEPLPFADLAAMLGINGIQQKGAPIIVRSLARLVRFDAARFDGDRFFVRTHLPPLTLPRLARLSPLLQRMHDSFIRTEGAKQ